MPATDANQGQTATSDLNAAEQNFPASDSIGATINEGMRIPEDVLAIEVIEFETNHSDQSDEPNDTAAQEDQESSDFKKRGMDTVRQYLAKMHKGIQARPLPFVLGAAGVGFLCGRRLAGGTRSQDVNL